MQDVPHKFVYVKAQMSIISGCETDPVYEKVLLFAIVGYDQVSKTFGLVAVRDTEETAAYGITVSTMR